MHCGSGGVEHIAQPQQQDLRRASLIAAVLRTIIPYGSAGAILNRIVQDRAGCSADGLLLFSGISIQIFDAIRHAMNRLFNERVMTVQEFSGPVEAQLRLMISLGLQIAADDPEVWLLCEMGGVTARYPMSAAILLTLLGCVVTIYRLRIDRGVEEGVFPLGSSPIEISRNLVSFEDVHGNRMAGNHPTISREHTIELIMEYVRQSLRCELSHESL